MNTSTFSTPSTSGISTMLDDLCRPRRPRAKMRVGNAPAGRILLLLMQMLDIKILPAATQLATINGVLAYMADPAFTPGESVDMEIFALITAQIDRSEHRSLVARERAALRKAARESVPSAPAVPEPQTPAPPSVPVPAPKPRPEPETIVSICRPAKKPLPRYRVLSDEEMNAEPYDPFGAHRAYEIQCGRRRR